VFIKLVEEIGNGKSYEELTTPLVRYLSRGEDVMKYETERLLYAVYDKIK
jgi:hypothetical protein